MKIVKDLVWPNPDITLPRTALEVVHNLAAQHMQQPGSSFGTQPFHTLARCWHARVGSQVWVSADVIHDLDHTDIYEADFASVPWMAPSLEFVFEDPELPSTHLFQYLPETFNMLRGYIPPQIIDHIQTPSLWEGKTWYGIAVPVSCATSKDASACQLASPAEFNQLTIDCSADVDNTVAQMVNRIKLLIFKVLFFASIDHLKPTATMELPTKAEGGKPGFKGRPRTPRYKVVYLPQQREALRAAAREDNGAETATRKFTGRRGHMRTFRADRYTTMKGKRIFIAPVPIRLGSLNPCWGSSSWPTSSSGCRRQTSAVTSGGYRLASVLSEYPRMAWWS